MKQKIPIKQAAFAAAGIGLLIILAVLPAPLALSRTAEAVGCDPRTAMRVLGITAMAILWWVGEVIPDWLTAIAMLLLWVLIGGFSFTTAFASFCSTSAWLIVGAFCLAAGITKTGFFRRISWFLLRKFSPTFRGQVLALLIVGTICAPLVPSTTAKAVLGATIANNIADAMGYESNSRGRCGLFVASFVGFSASAPAFMSGSVFTYVMLGALSDEARAGIDWLSWLIYCLPWLIVLLVAFFFVIQRMYRPTDGAQLTSEYVEQKYRSLGQMKGKEILSAALLVFAVVLWILESYLGISAAVTAMIAAFFCFLFGILEPQEISTAVPWKLVIFLGGVLNLGTILSKAGIDLWIQDMLSPLFAQMSGRVLILVAITVLVLLLRLLLVSQSATLIVAMAILTPAVSAVGIHPFIVGFIVLVAEQCWFLPYQNVVFSPALSCMKESVNHRQTVAACVAFELISLAGCLISIPCWKALGLL